MSTLIEAFLALLFYFNRKSVFINVLETCCINFALKRKHRNRRSLKQHRHVTANKRQIKVYEILKFVSQGEKSSCEKGKMKAN